MDNENPSRRFLRRGPIPPGHGVFVGQHGSWNRKPRSGYRVLFVPFAEGCAERKAGADPVRLVQDDDALGRPVGVAMDRAGALLVADDVGNTIWRGAPSAAKSALRN
jgi:glucose/arabinose dehydrogenase